MIPRNLDAQTLYVLGAIFVAIAVVTAAAGALIKRRLEEEHRDERYVRERRGEEVAPREAPRIAGALQWVGAVAAAVGILLLVAGWTVTPGQS